MRFSKSIFAIDVSIALRNRIPTLVCLRHGFITKLCCLAADCAHGLLLLHRYVTKSSKLVDHSSAWGQDHGYKPDIVPAEPMSRDEQRHLQKLEKQERKKNRAVSGDAFAAVLVEHLLRALPLPHILQPPIVSEALLPLVSAATFRARVGESRVRSRQCARAY